MSGLDPLRHFRSLVVAKVKEPVAENMSTKGSAELIPVIRSALACKIVRRIKVRIPKEFEGAAVQIVCSGLRGDDDLPTAEVSVLCAEIARENAEFRDRIKIGHHARDVVEVLFDRAAVHRKAICSLPLTADRNIAGVEIARWRSGGATRHHDGIRLLGTLRNHASLQSQKIREAPSIQRNGQQFLLPHGFAHLRRGKIQLRSGSVHFHGFLVRFYLQHHIQAEGHRCVHFDAILLVRPEASGRDVDPVSARRQHEFEPALVIRLRCLRVSVSDALDAHRCTWNDRSTWIGDCTGKLLRIIGQSTKRSQDKEPEDCQDAKEAGRRP